MFCHFIKKKGKWYQEKWRPEILHLLFCLGITGNWIHNGHCKCPNMTSACFVQNLLVYFPQLWHCKQMASRWHLTLQNHQGHLKLQSSKHHTQTCLQDSIQILSFKQQCLRWDGLRSQYYDRPSWICSWILSLHIWHHLFLQFRERFLVENVCQ